MEKQYAIFRKGSLRTFTPVFRGFIKAKSGAGAIKKMFEKDKRMGGTNRIRKNDIYYAIPSIGKFQFNPDKKGSWKKPR